MDIFDPPQLKPKPKKRVGFLYPEGINRKLFVWIYFGSILFWLLLIVGVGALIIFIFLPFLGVVISSNYQILFMMGFLGISIFFGMSMASKVVNGIILQGITFGDILIK
ncbi:MAG: hypothetical protein P1P90_06005 [Patescibacteria group bacterium]|nr:hypothetical protein [Patescibacteria group bacterium]